MGGESRCKRPALRRGRDIAPDALPLFVLLLCICTQLIEKLAAWLRRRWAHRCRRECWRDQVYSGSAKGQLFDRVPVFVAADCSCIRCCRSARRAWSLSCRLSGPCPGRSSRAVSFLRTHDELSQRTEAARDSNLSKRAARPCMSQRRAAHSELSYQSIEQVAVAIWLRWQLRAEIVLHWHFWLVRE